MNAPTLMGVAFAAMGVFVMAVSGLLANWATNMHLFLRTEQKTANRERKRRMRSIAWVLLILAAGILMYDFIVELTT